MPVNRGQEKLRLAGELLEDIELSRLSGSALVLKASRLARLLEDDEAATWLGYEQLGIPRTGEGRSHMTRTGRWADEEEGSGYFQGLAEVEGFIAVGEARLASLRLPDVGGEWASVALRETRQDMSAVARELARQKAVQAKVVALIHQFAVRSYHELLFSEQQQQLFEMARTSVDAQLSPLAGDALLKVESIYRRLEEGDPEATSQALSTCRRLVDAVADAIWPPAEGTAVVGGNELQVGPQHHKNRLNVFISERTTSATRRSRLRRTLDDLYERVSAGVHADVSADEARFLFLSTYTYLGEVLSLGPVAGPTPA